VTSDLPVEDLGRDIGIVGGDLSPALLAGISGDANEADEFIGEGLELADDHAPIFQLLWSSPKLHFDESPDQFNATLMPAGSDAMVK
jgi:hypothetical protein